MRPAMKFSLFMILNAVLTVLMIAMIVADAKAATIASIVSSAVQ